MTPFTEGLIAGSGIAIPVDVLAILIVEMGLRCGFKVGFMVVTGAAVVGWLTPGSRIILALVW